MTDRRADGGLHRPVGAEATVDELALARGGDEVRGDDRPRLACARHRGQHGVRTDGVAHAVALAQAGGQRHRLDGVEPVRPQVVQQPRAGADARVGAQQARDAVRRPRDVHQVVVLGEVEVMDALPAGVQLGEVEQVGDRGVEVRLGVAQGLFRALDHCSQDLNPSSVLLRASGSSP